MNDRNTSESTADWRCDLALVQRYLHERTASEGAHGLPPICIVDLAPGNGERAWQLLSRLPERDVRYLALSRTAETYAYLLGHPSLSHMTQQGRLRIAHQPENEAEWRSVLPDAHGPLVILAHGLFSTLRHDLYACHYGHWMQPDPNVTEGQGWQSIAPTDPLGRLLAPAYLHSLNSTSLLLPNGSVECLEPLLRVSGDRYLLVASDTGITQLSEIRLGALHATPEFLASTARVPVNFQALQVWQQALGAASLCAADASRAEHVRYLALCDGTFPEMAYTLPAFQDAWSNVKARTDGWRAIAALAPIGDDKDAAASAFILWQVSDYAPEILAAFADLLIRRAGEVEGSALEGWRKALTECCAYRFPASENDCFHRMAAHMAAALGMWSFAVSLFEVVDDLGGIASDDILMLSRCLQMCGRSELALDRLESEVLSGENDDCLRGEYQTLHERLQRWHELPWYASDIAALEMLRLEPLGPQHASPMLYQYRDPQIAMMTRLPEFTDARQLEDWIVERGKEQGRMDFALMHADYGFAGVISAHRVGPNAFFHFWIGADFQGRGLARPAFELLRAQLLRLDVQRIFTTVYPDNFRSLRTLRRCGFQPMPDRALPPEDEMPFFCLQLSGARRSDRENSLALRDYSARSGGVFIFAALAEDAALA